MGGIDEIDDPNVGLGSVLSMQAAGVLLQGAFPGHRQSEEQRIESRVIESFADATLGFPGSQPAQAAFGAR